MSKRRQQKMNVFKISFDVTLMVGEVYGLPRCSDQHHHTNEDHLHLILSLEECLNHIGSHLFSLLDVPPLMSQAGSTSGSTLE